VVRVGRENLCKRVRDSGRARRATIPRRNFQERSVADNLRVDLLIESRGRQPKVEPVDRLPQDERIMDELSIGVGQVRAGEGIIVARRSRWLRAAHEHACRRLIDQRRPQAEQISRAPHDESGGHR